MPHTLRLDPTPPVSGPVIEDVLRVVAPNPGPYTFTGTCSYVVGGARPVVIDPGPDDPAQEAAILAALAGRKVAAVVVTHTHRDHSPLAARLARRFAAPVVGAAPHRPARPAREGEDERLDASVDHAYRPDRTLADGETIEADGTALRTIATPGHTANHLCFVLEGRGALFSGDHVMAWSTSMVAPPDGDMAAYMASLERIGALAATERLFLPGHGAAIEGPDAHCAALLAHRRARESAILEAIAGAGGSPAALAERLYVGLAPALLPAAALSVLAHLEKLEREGFAERSVDGGWRRARFSRPSGSGRPRT
jgi:hydroxyacylglutathione hydrolase